MIYYRTIYFLRKAVPFVISLILIFSAFVIILNIKKFLRWFPPKDYLFFIVSVPTVFISAFILKKRIRFWEIFQHEMTHLIFTVITLNRVEGFSITRNSGGSVAVYGENNTLNKVAPYFFPLYSIILIGLSLFFVSDYEIVLQKSAWIIWLFFVIQFLKDFSMKQSDISTSFKPLSIPLIICGNIFFFFFIIHFSTGNLNYFIKYYFKCGDDLWNQMILKIGF